MKYFCLNQKQVNIGVVQVESATQNMKNIKKHSKQVDISVVQVEFTHSNKTNILRIMDAAGYDNPFNLEEDLIFVKRTRRKQFTWKVPIRGRL